MVTYLQHSRTLHACSVNVAKRRRDLCDRSHNFETTRDVICVEKNAKKMQKKNNFQYNIQTLRRNIGYVYATKMIPLKVSIKYLELYS